MRMMTDISEEKTVTLPGGLVESGRCARIAALRPLSGREEEWLALHPATPNAIRVSRLLGSCLRSLEDRPVTEITAGDLLLADRDYLMLQLRMLTLGDTVWALLPCPACGSSMDVNFQMSDVPVLARPQENQSYSIQVGSAERTRTVYFRLPTGKDQEAVVGMEIDRGIDTLFGRCVLDDGGQALIAEERTALEEAMVLLAPDVQLDLDLTCPECDHDFTSEFDTTAFFLDEMSMKGDQLLREVHTLALCYHWSEAEILAMPRDRRRAYLDLVGESLRVD